MFEIAEAVDIDFQSRGGHYRITVRRRSNQQLVTQFLAYNRKDAQDRLVGMHFASNTDEQEALRRKIYQ